MIVNASSTLTGQKRECSSSPPVVARPLLFRVQNVWHRCQKGAVENLRNGGQCTPLLRKSVKDRHQTSAKAGAGRWHLVHRRVRSAFCACAVSKISRRKRVRTLATLPNPPGQEEKRHPCIRLWKRGKAVLACFAQSRRPRWRVHWNFFASFFARDIF